MQGKRRCVKSAAHAERSVAFALLPLTLMIETHAMTTATFRRRELDFQLNELLDMAGLLALPRYAQHDAESLSATLDAALRLAQDRFAPHAAITDADEPRMVDGRVILRPEIKAATDAYIASGFLSAYFDEADGGAQLPFVLTTAINAVFAAASAGIVGYACLSAAAAHLLLAHGSPAQKAAYGPHMLSGRFFGTMCLSEPQAGSSLADLRTRATPQPDGTYHLRGNKMWISGGEHDLAENIIHFVLARIDGAPAGAAGISLFIVPRDHVTAGGAVGARNGVRLIGLNHKMGNRATVNTALNLGEDEPCVGELMGEPGKGLAAMFQMMNEARLGVGVFACGLGMAGYLYSVEYARTRLQGRALTTKDPTQPPIPIIQHPDVRRMLLLQRAWVEGSLALCLTCARLVDEAACAQDLAERAALHSLLDLLTPIAKAYPSDACTRANDLAIQVLGGYGYSREYPVERLWRDNRLNAIHEGTNGVQGLDLLGRKVLRDQGRALSHLAARVAATTSDAADDARCAPLAAQLTHALGQAHRATASLSVLASAGQLACAMSHSTAYLEMLGHVVVGWMWLRQARVASQALDRGGLPAADQRFYTGKLAVARAFSLYELPRVDTLAALLISADPLLTSLDDEAL
jgi:alkylation response protein AidB-like acyl-CoA dehydrogenase